MLSRPMHIGAVIVCVNYGDFLAETLKENLAQLDEIVVVSDHEDSYTHQICARLNIPHIGTDVMYRDVDRPAFNKSRAINHGLAHLSFQDYVLQMDADIALPPQWRKHVVNADLDKTCIYGWDRVDIQGPEEWDKIKGGQLDQHEWGCFTHFPAGKQVGTRLWHGDYAGWLPIGFAQLWNPNGSGIKRYPCKIDADMEHTDVLHALQWPRHKRVLLPESILYHLVSGGECRKANNWHGRKSPPFRPQPGSNPGPKS